MSRLVWRFVVTACLLGGSGVCHAQQPEDPRIAIYRQMLTRANDELSQAMSQANALAIENAKLKADMAKPKEGDKKE